MPKTIRRLAAPILLSAAALAPAGELRLDNGAVIPGTLVSIDATTVSWKADKIGKISVAKSDVKDLHTTDRATVRESLHQPPQDDCLVQVRDSKWSIDCGPGPVQSVAFAQLRSLPAVPSSNGKLTMGLDIDRGTSPSEEVAVDLDARWLRKGYRHNVYISTDYQQTDGSKTTDKADAYYQYDVVRDAGWYWFGRTRYYRNEFEALKQAYAGGGGLGREFTPTENLNLSLQGGPAIMYYQFTEQGWQTNPGAIVSWTVVWQTPWREVELSHTGDLGWVYSVTDAYLFQSRTGLTFPLYQGLVGELRLDYDLSGVRGGGNSDYDMEWVMALGYKW